MICEWVLAGRRPALSAELEREHGQYVQLMRWCWQQLPSARPSMSQVQRELHTLHSLLTSPSGHAVLMSPAHQMSSMGAGAFPSVSGSGASFAGSGFVALCSGPTSGSVATPSSALKPLASSGSIGQSTPALPSQFPLIHTQPAPDFKDCPDPNPTPLPFSASGAVRGGGLLAPLSEGTAFASSNTDFSAAASVNSLPGTGVASSAANTSVGRSAAPTS